jgi:primary-amine oxidase
MATPTPPTVPAAIHPLAPLTVEEQDRVVRLARSVNGLGQRLRFTSIEAREPEKSEYLRWRDAAGPRPARQATVVLVDCDAGRGGEVLVDLDRETVLEHRQLAGGLQPGIHIEEFHLAGSIVRADPRYRAALAARGIEDPDLVHIEAWTAGSFEDRGRRLVRALSWLGSGEDVDNQYARPLAGLVAVVDLNALEVVRLDDHSPGTAPPTIAYPYHQGHDGQWRDDLRSLEIIQADGPSFSLDADRVLRWQKWELIVGFHPREGLVLHDIAYLDGGERRQICHRASIAELVIPYGDPNPTVHFKGAFDVGEYGMGPLVNSLSLGCDCLGEIRYLDVVVNGLDGTAVTIPNGICIHEEDDNILWKHTHSSGRVDRARARRLVVSSICTVGNYEYGYFWYFYQDGSWAFEGKLTGIVHTAGRPDGARSPHALPLGDGLVSSYHQHFFCARLDLDIDGVENTSHQADAVSHPWGPDNPDGIAFGEVRTVFERESEARAVVSPATARRFRVESAGRRNRIGDPTSYELVPGENVMPMAQPESAIRSRARMLDHHLWVTPYRREERYPAGEYPNQSSPGQGLPAWTAADRPLAASDVVLWYIFGAHHVPRLEDWPVMPVARIGFQLRPVGFFDANPALDVPPPPPADHCH